MCRSKLTVWVLLTGWLTLGLALPGAAWAKKKESIDESNHTLRWDQTLHAADRFEVLAAFGGRAILDKETGLVWEQAPLTTVLITWGVAPFQCPGSTTGGRKGWRLPSVHELASLVDPSVAFPRPTLPLGHPFLNVQSGGYYWSATTWVGNPANAWVVFFDNGGVNTKSKGDAFGHAWCARGGMNADQY